MRSKDGCVLHMASALRGRISRHLYWLFLKMELSSFTYHTGPLVERFATHNSV